MCLIAFAWQVHPEFPLVFAGNRDEFFNRPTEPAHWWEGSPAVLAGRDMQAGGTWCGLAEGGRLAALTNFRAPSEHNPKAPSRGALVGGFLSSKSSIPAYLEEIRPQKAAYNGFNLVLGEDLNRPEHAQLWIDSNRDATLPRRLEPGIYGVSNAKLDTPWPKVEAIKTGLCALLTPLKLDQKTLVHALLELLADDHLAEEGALPKTGVPLEVERTLSAAFVRMPGYGTRTSSVVLADRQGRLEFLERSFEPGGAHTDRQFWLGPGGSIPA
jgi:uncharacterized protein with NRDE domain